MVSKQQLEELINKCKEGNWITGSHTGSDAIRHVENRQVTYMCPYITDDVDKEVMCTWAEHVKGFKYRKCAYKSPR